MVKYLNFESREDAFKQGYGLGAKTVDGIYSFMYWHGDEGEIFTFHPRRLRITPQYRLPVHKCSLGFDAMRIDDLRKIKHG